MKKESDTPDLFSVENTVPEYILGEPLGVEVVGEPEILSDPPLSTQGAVDRVPVTHTPPERFPICQDFGCQAECYVSLIVELKARVHELEIQLCLPKSK